MKCIIDDSELEKLGINLPKVLETEAGYEEINVIKNKIEINGVQYMLDKTMPAEVVTSIMSIVYPYKCESDKSYITLFKKFLQSMMIKMVNKGSNKYGNKIFIHEDERIEVNFTLQNRKEVLYNIKRYGSEDSNVISLDDYETAFELLKELRVL